MTCIALQRASFPALLRWHRQVLIAGGQAINTNSNNGLVTTEIFDPASNTYLIRQNMFFARYYHTATLLPDGKVLMIGGASGAGIAVKTSEVYDPATNTFTPSGNMATARKEHSAFLLDDGKVCVSLALLSSHSYY